MQDYKFLCAAVTICVNLVDIKLYIYFFQILTHVTICTLGRYENWPQCWLWIVIPASASVVTPKEH